MLTMDFLKFNSLMHRIQFQDDEFEAESLVQEEMNKDRIRCGLCEFTQACVSAVLEHHKQEHPHQQFHWQDTTNGYTCNDTGQVRGHATRWYGLMKKMVLSGLSITC